MGPFDQARTGDLAAPLLIIICLGAITWLGTHLLDPYRPIDRIADGRPVAADAQPLEVDVVALDWKWMFFYPQYGIATINQMAAPVDRPIDFKLTSVSVMNAFYIPALAGMVATMPGMETQLHAVINKPGTYDGFSTNYSGAGFSNMNFKFLGPRRRRLRPVGLEGEAAGCRARPAGYLKLEIPSEAAPVMYFSSYEKGLFHDVLNMCVKPGKVCMDKMLQIDRNGGGEKEVDRSKLTYDAHQLDGIELGAEPGATVPASERSPHSDKIGPGPVGPPNANEKTIAPPQMNQAD